MSSIGHQQIFIELIEAVKVLIFGVGNVIIIKGYEKRRSL